MANNSIKGHIQHLKSKVVLDNKSPKTPNTGDLLLGEIAINYAKGYETISFVNEDKNGQKGIVTIQNDIAIGGSTPPEGAYKLYIDTEADKETEVYTKEQIDSQLSGITNSISSINTTNGTNDTRISALESKDAAHDSRLDEYKGRIETLESKSTDVDNSISRISELESKDGEYDYAFNTVNGKLDNYSDRIAALEVNKTENETAINQINADLTEVKALINEKITRGSNAESEGNQSTNIFIEEGSDGDTFNVYTKAQVDSMIAAIKQQIIDELKG